MMVSAHRRLVNRCSFSRTLVVTLVQTASVSTAFSVVSKSRSFPEDYSRESYHQAALRIVPSFSPLQCLPILRRRCLYSSRTDHDGISHLKTPEESKMTNDSLDIVNKAIQAIDPIFAIQQNLHHVSEDRFQIGLPPSTTTNPGAVNDSNGHRPNEMAMIELGKYDKIVLVAFGKASSAMATAVLDRLLESSELPELSGLVIAKDGHATEQEISKLKSHHIRVMEASHPVPDERSVQAAEDLLDLVRTSASDRTLVIACISGGGSALFCAPHPKLTMKDLQDCNTALLQSGWNIQEMNVVRKRLESGKGGRLAAAAFPGQIVSLILSDVLGDPLDLIASGPTVPDTSTWQDAWELVNQSLPEETTLPDSVMQLLQDGKNGKITDSPAADHPVFENSCNLVVGNNALAVSAAAEHARALGYHPVVLGTQLQGEACQVAQVLVSLAQHLRQESRMPYPMAYKFPIALVAGGETTVSIPSQSEGKGGRNQELALAAAISLNKAQLRQIVLTSVGTDGNDGPTDAAGAVVDGGTIERLNGEGKSATEALQMHNAYPYLEQEDKTGHSPLIKIGPTGTNVADICLVLIHDKEL